MNRDRIQTLVAEISRAREEFNAPIDQTVDPVTIKTSDGIPVMELTSACKGAFRQQPVLILDVFLAAHSEIQAALKDSGFRVITVSSQQELIEAARMQGFSEAQIQEKITGLTHVMRSDAELLSLAEVVRAMPVAKLAMSEKKSHRPARHYPKTENVIGGINGISAARRSPHESADFGRRHVDGRTGAGDC
jgi:hypothetical protein